MTVYWVKAKKHAYPYAEKRIAGPFGESGDAWAEMKRLAPLWPDCVLSTVHKNMALKRAAVLLNGPKIEPERTEAP